MGRGTANGLPLHVCRICGAADAVLLASKDHWHYFRCAGCDFAFLDPMPDAPALDGVYHLAEGYGNSAYHAKRRSRLRRAFFRLPRFLPLILGKDVLDVGCGGGINAAVFARFARRSVGVDASASAIAYARSQGSRAEYLQVDCCSEQHIGAFDFVYAADVIEHLVNLDAFLQFLARNTAPRGCVYIATPDFASPRRPRDVTHWDVLTPPYHVQFFNERNLTLAFARHGFQCVRRYRSTKLGLNILFRRCA
jgi:2-polyprenyl-3-methyl-5-hydroxy-6-metoxy-1,4-benzoquinol methylase